MCIVSTIAIVVCSTLTLKLLWLIRIGSLAHWSYIIGTSFYPKDINGSIILSVGVFGFIILGSLIPSFLFPRVKFVATALSIPPQLHMLLLLHRNIAIRLENETVTKTIRAYTAVTLISTVWTVISLLRRV